MSKFNVGDKVKYIGKGHRKMPRFYPEIGTIGTVVQEVDENKCYIQWPKGNTSEEDCWYCSNNDIELVKNEDMTNEEIWEMLENKMRKNGLKSTTSTIRLPAKWCYGDPLDIVKSYDESDVHNAIALAYKVGYFRAMKGRPFKIGEKKKQGGHWVPVDPENLPKEGTKVRYARHIDDEESFSGWTGIQIGDETIVSRNYGEFWVKDIHNVNLGRPLCSHSHPERFDMWVEEDE